MAKRKTLDRVMSAADERKHWRNKAAHAALSGDAKAAARYLRYAQDGTKETQESAPAKKPRKRKAEDK